MIQQRLRKAGNSYVVTIPRSEIERLGLKEGELVGVTVQRLEVRPVLAPDLREAVDRSWKRHESAYHYLAEH